MIRVDIVCPVYREAATISSFHRALLSATDDLKEQISFTYIYVLDPSEDPSEEILKSIAATDPRVSVIVMSRRFGHQAALIAGLDNTTGDAVIMLDSDLQHPPELIPELIAQWESGADIVQACRQDDTAVSFNQIASNLFYDSFNRLSNINIKPGAADFRLLTRRIVTILCNDFREQNPFVRGLVNWVGFKIVYVPYHAAPRRGGRSNYSVSALALLAAHGLCSFSKPPLRLCTFIGVFFSVISIVGGLANLALYFFFRNEYAPGWASIFALQVFGIGINLLFLGVIGEYVGLIYDEAKRRPRYLISATHGSRDRHSQSQE